MAHRGVCPHMACERVAIELERQASERKACQVVADELGIPVKTVLTWIYRDKVTSNEVTKGQANNVEKEAPTIINLHTLQFESGRKKIAFGLGETDDNRFLVMQELKVGKIGKENPTKNRLTMPVDMIAQFKSALDQVEAQIQEGCSGGLNIDDSVSQDAEEGETPAGDDEDLAQDNAVDLNGGDKERSPAPTDATEDTTVEAELVQCADCVHFEPKKYAPEENGACNSRSGSWNGPVFQSPDKPHPCPNFHGEEHE